SLWNVFNCENYSPNKLFSYSCEYENSLSTQKGIFVVTTRIVSPCPQKPLPMLYYLYEYVQKNEPNPQKKKQHPRLHPHRTPGGSSHHRHPRNPRSHGIR